MYAHCHFKAYPVHGLETVDDLLYTLKMTAVLSHGHKSLVVKEKQKGHETRSMKHDGKS